MKKILKSRLFLVIITVIITGSITGVVAYNYSANQVSYTPKDTNWNVDNVEDAINDLKDNGGGFNPILLWTNPNPTSTFSAQTISLDLSTYKYVIVVTNDSYRSDDYNRSNGIVPVGDEYSDVGIGRVGRSSTLRHFKAISTGVVVSNDEFGSGGDGNKFVIPYKIYGVKEDINIDLKKQS